PHHRTPRPRTPPHLQFRHCPVRTRLSPLLRFAPVSTPAHAPVRHRQSPESSSWIPLLRRILTIVRAPHAVKRLSYLLTLWAHLYLRCLPPSVSPPCWGGCGSFPPEPGAFRDVFCLNPLAPQNLPCPPLPHIPLAHNRPLKPPLLKLPPLSNP